jgi:hypothetical protein
MGERRGEERSLIIDFQSCDQQPTSLYSCRVDYRIEESDMGSL